MKENQPTLTTKDIRNVLKICTDLDYISEKQRKDIETMFNLSYHESVTEKRNKRSLWERFANDFADLLEDYNILPYIEENGSKIHIVFNDDVENNWRLPIDYSFSIAPENIRKWPGIVKRQKKLSEMINSGEIKIEHIEQFHKLMWEAQTERGLFAPKTKIKK